MKTQDVSPGLLARVGRILGWVPITFSGVTVVDKDAWLYAAARATRGERVAMLLATAPHLLAATEAGRLRLKRATVSDLEIEPTLYGDGFALPIIRSALGLVPAPVRYAVVADVAFVAVGVDSRGWTGSANFTDVSGVRREIVIVLGPTIDVQLVLHEIAHAWHTEPRLTDEAWLHPLISVRGEQGLRELAVSYGFSDQLERHVSDHETVADACALAWLYAGTGERAAA